MKSISYCGAISENKTMTRFIICKKYGPIVIKLTICTICTYGYWQRTTNNNKKGLIESITLELSLERSQICSSNDVMKSKSFGRSADTTMVPPPKKQMKQDRL